MIYHSYAPELRISISKKHDAVGIFRIEPGSIARCGRPKKILGPRTNSRQPNTQCAQCLKVCHKAKLEF